MPKSSMARRTPSRLSFFMTSRAPDRSSMTIGLGDLEDEQLRGQAGGVERRRHLRQQPALLELARREVDADGQVHAQPVPDRAHLPARLVQHVTAQRQDQPGLLGHRDEPRRADQAVGGVPPPHQRLGAHDVLLVQRVERLVVHLELVPLEPLAQIGLDLQPLGGAGSHGGLVEHPVDAAAALGLGVVHGHVGVAEHVVGRLARLGQGDADRHAGHQLVAVGQHHGLLDGGADAPGRGDRHVHAGHVLQQHHELVAAEAGQQVVAADDPLHPGPDRRPGTRRRSRGRGCR